MAKQTYLGDEIVGVYAPGDIAKNWAPQWFLARTIQDLAAGFRATRSSLNPLARKYFLATFCVERSTMVLNHTTSDPAVARHMREKMPLSACGEGLSPVWSACQFAVVLDYKTGPYAERVYGKDASKAQRLAIWNGRGKYIDQSGRVGADANNHAKKVFEMHEELKKPHNRDFVDVFVKHGGESPV